uniref:Uncharacterized protein n=1 Tax=Anopheles culicifacies TaxID=139723 RepID=A0A182MET2_9DIPT
MTECIIRCQCTLDPYISKNAAFFTRAAQPILLFFITKFLLDFREVEVFASAALENVEHIQTGGLKVCGCIVRLRDEHLGLQTFIGWFVVIRNGQKLLCDRPEQIETGLNLRFGIVSLHRCGYHGNKPSLGRYLMCRANERYVNVRLAVDLHLWNDDLSRKGILRIGDRVIQQANAANNLSRNAYLRK